MAKDTSARRSERSVPPASVKSKELKAGVQPRTTTLPTTAAASSAAASGKPSPKPAGKPSASVMPVHSTKLAAAKGPATKQAEVMAVRSAATPSRLPKLPPASPAKGTGKHDGKLLSLIHI